ncbi:MAG: hypothetical protein ABIJ50_09905 [Pseudomonadota bacterium]
MLNQLNEAARFLFQPGMLFNDTIQWWEVQQGSFLRRAEPCHYQHWKLPALRPRLHEGIDIYQIEHFDMRSSYVLPQMLIPAILPGELIHFHRDFLGETLYIRHADIQQEGAVLHTLYGHVSSIPEVKTTPSFTPGSFTRTSLHSSPFHKGQIVGTISPPSETSKVPAHLHISCAWIHEDQLVKELNWKNMSTSANVVFIDPLPFLLR